MPHATPDISLRLASPTDLPTVLNIRHTAILALAPDRMTTEDATTWADRPDHPERWQVAIEKQRVWLAYEGDQAVAWFSVTDDFVDGLYVIPRRQHSGVGSTLLGVAEIMIKDGGHEAARLNTAEATVGFYEKMGYEVMGPAPMGAGTRMWKSMF